MREMTPKSDETPEEDAVSEGWQLFRNRLLEIYLWTLIAGAFVLGPALIARTPMSSFLPQYTENLIIGGSLLLLIIVFELIFGALPIELVGRWARSSSGRSVRGAHAARDASIPASSTASTNAEQSLHELTPAELLAIQAVSSKKIAKNIFSRAGVYLLVGVVVAFSGLAFFYSQTNDMSYALGTFRQVPASYSPDDYLVGQSSRSRPESLRALESVDDQQANARLGRVERALERYRSEAQSSRQQPIDMMGMLLLVLPNLGILIFIELVAFFFLRQYRSAMDEFRYFEAIQRKREEVLAFHKMIEKTGSDPLELAKNGFFFSDMAPLSAGQTTEILETRKLEKNELALLEKMIDAVSRVRGA